MFLDKAYTKVLTKFQKKNKYNFTAYQLQLGKHSPF